MALKFTAFVKMKIEISTLLPIHHFMPFSPAAADSACCIGLQSILDTPDGIKQLCLRLIVHHQHHF